MVVIMTFAHLQHPAGHRRDDDGEGREHRVVDGAADKRPVPSRDVSAGVTLSQREDLQLQAEHFDEDQGQEEVW
jgi:hypothetical protein